MGLDLRGKRVTLIGLGTRAGGLGVARYLTSQGAEVTVTDMRPAEALAEPLAALAGLPIRFVLGGHQEQDFTPERADLIVRNPGVPRRAPLLELARSHGIPVEMEMSLFFRACPAPIVGITGTKGKTTVSTLTGELLRSAFPDVVVAGNMGVSALEQLPRLRPDAPVVIELSSWQLEALIEHGLAPRIAVLTLIAEDHLNTYDDFADYAATKRGITRHQRPGDWLVVNRDDPEAWRAAGETAATAVPFGEGDHGDRRRVADRGGTPLALPRRGDALAASGVAGAGGAAWRPQRAGGSRRGDAGRSEPRRHRARPRGVPGCEGSVGDGR